MPTTDHSAQQDLSDESPGGEAGEGGLGGSGCIGGSFLVATGRAC